MNKKIRLTIIALLPKGMKAENVPSLIEKVVAGEDPTVIRTMYKTADLSNRAQRLYVKISKVIDAEEITDGWHHQITEAFKCNGCNDVAWRVTKITLEDYEPENTTASFPIELFQSFLEQAEDIILPEVPPEPFGSDTFWKRFEKDVQ